MSNPSLKAVVVKSGTIKGEFSLRAIKANKQVPFQLILKEAGFVPGDIVEVRLFEDVQDREALEARIEELETEVQYYEDAISRAIGTLENL